MTTTIVTKRNPVLREEMKKYSNVEGLGLDDGGIELPFFLYF